MKQINNSPDKSVLLRETFNSEASVRLNGGVCANVDFKSGKAFFQNTGSITYSNPVLSIGAFTIRARVKLTIVNQYNVIASFDNVSTIELRTDLGGELVMYVDSVKKSSGKVLAVNTWYDIVVTRDDSGVIIFYVNGESFSGGTQAGIFYNKNLTIGKRGAGTTLYYNGYMDLFEYYDRSMTAAEITYILNDRAFRITDQVKRDRVAISGGTQGKIIYYKSLITFYRKRGMWDKTHICLVPFLGYKASSGLIDTVYDLKGAILKNNDATQGTTANKPRIAGYIAPNEVLAAKNPNGDARFFTHPTISFAANEAWSVCWIGNFNFTALDYAQVCGGSTFWIALKDTINKRISFRNTSGTIYGFSANSSLPVIGKISSLHIIADGAGNITAYVNSTSIGTISASTAMLFDRLFGNATDRYFNGTSHYYRIQSGAMTPSQITAEYDLLRSWIPEIESVTIGSQVWASSNLDVVATPLGNVIPEVQPAGAVEKIVNGNFEGAKVNSDDAGMVSTIVADGTLGSNVLELVQAAAGTGGAGNRTLWNAPTGLTETPINSNGKWIKVSFKAISISGNTALAVTNTAGVGLYRSITTSWITYTGYYKQGDGGASVMAYLTGGAGTFRIDDLKFEVLNWSNATEIYDAVYAATSGTADQKHYAAVKAASMWCYFDNSTANGAIYGKILNGYAIKLLRLDMITANYGYKPPLQADWDALETYLDIDAGNDVKHNGTIFWSAPNGGTNSSGLTILPGGYRNAQGAFVGLNDEVYMITADEADDRIGGYARLIKD